MLWSPCFHCYIFCEWIWLGLVLLLLANLGLLNSHGLIWFMLLPPHLLHTGVSLGEWVRISSGRREILWVCVLVCVLFKLMPQQVPKYSACKRTLNVTSLEWLCAGLILWVCVCGLNPSFQIAAMAASYTLSVQTYPNCDFIAWSDFVRV